MAKHHVGKIVLRSCRPQKIRINLRGILNIFRAARQQLKEFRVVNNLRPLRIAQHRRQRFQRFSLFIHPHCAPFSRFAGNFNSANARAESFRFTVAAFQLEPDGKRRFRRKFFQPGAKFLRVGKLRIVLFGSGFDICRRGRLCSCRGAKLLQQRTETKFAIKRRKRHIVRRPHFQFFNLYLNRCIQRDRRQLLGHHHLLALLLQRLAIPLIGNFVRVIQSVFNASIFLDQLRGAFFSDSLCARNVVNRVAQKRHVIHNFVRWHAENLLHFFLVDKNVALRAARSRAQRAYIFPDELHHVLIVRNDQHIQILFRALNRHGANHVVCFIPFHFQNRQVHRLAQPLHVRQLHAHLIRHRLALRFVFFKKFVAARRARWVENNSDVVRLVVFDETLQDISEQIRDIGGYAARPGQPHRHRRKKSTVNMRHRIHKKQFLSIERHRASIANAPLAVATGLDTKKRGAARGDDPGGPFSQINDYWFFCFWEFDFGSGFCVSAPVGFVSPACAPETISIRVPLSRRTFFPPEVINEPSVPFAAAAFRFSPFSPNTPRLFEANCPAEFRPPTAPPADPATPVVVRAVASTAPPAALVALPAVFVTVPTAPPAVDIAPPSAPRPPPIARPPPPAPTSVIASRSAPPARAAVSALASAWILPFNATSCPFFKIALSNAIPSADSASPLPRADARVTCPTSFAPFGTTVFPCAFTASVVRAVTPSPGLAFFESTGAVSAALIAVPSAIVAFEPLACTALDDEADALAFADAGFVLTLASACAPA